AIIMPNVKIGKFCVVAANSFVNKSFDDYSLIAGSPAKFIKKIK
ncbi:MAG: acyltransferase, partial [Rickettsiales bacterium]